MEQVNERFDRDEAGNLLSGGLTNATGLSIRWNDDTIPGDPNGTTPEVVIAAALGRLKAVGGQDAIVANLQAALDALVPPAVNSAPVVEPPVAPEAVVPTLGVPPVPT